MRAEGGEALAIINKRRTRQYKKVLPDVIESFNKGTFEEKYINAFSTASNIMLAQTGSVDLTAIESTLHDIKAQGDTRFYYGPNGEVIEVKKNVKRIIRS